MMETTTEIVSSPKVSQTPLVSVVMPCLNEEQAIGSCIQKIKQTFKRANIYGEIVVCDNGSSDQSVEIAESMGVRVVHQPIQGYGNAYLEGFLAAKGDYLIMGDADDTYDFSLIPQFLDKLIHEKYDFVTGSRYLHPAGNQSNPWLHRWFGNPALTSILNLLFGTRYTDVYCGFRGFSRKAYDIIKPVSPGMEFNLELAINAGLGGLKIAEIPICLHPRKGESKLSPIRDGWRSLRMMLLYCPNAVFLYPGAMLMLSGILLHLAGLFGFLQSPGKAIGLAVGICATILSVIGFEVLSFGLHAKTYSWSRRFNKNNPTLQKFYQFFKLETGILLGLGMILSGSVMLILSLAQSLETNAPDEQATSLIFIAATLIMLGCGTMFSTVFISAMSLKKIEMYDMPK
jgi:glycosyltransferase involved in cell wall biosynthesis